MESIRIHNDLHFRWAFFLTGGDNPVPYDLTGKDLSIVITNFFGKEFSPSFTIEENVAVFDFFGKDQTTLGDYTLTMLENAGKIGERAIDKITPFTLVARQETVVSDVPSSCHFPTLGIETIELSSTLGSGAVEHPYISLERLRHYLYRVTFDKLPKDNGGDSPVAAGCSSYVKDGKLHTNLDWDYDNTASFIVRTRDFEGQSFIKGLDDGKLYDALIAQLPYRVHRGVNDYGISLASHILFNDWGWTGCGEKSINLTRLPFLVMSKVKSMATIAQDLAGVLDNLYCPEGLAALGYLLQLIVTDGTTTYAIVPPLSEGEPFELVDATEFPKMTNFRYVARGEVSRYDMDLQDRPTGIERFNMMPCDPKDLRFTLGYESVDRLSEFIGLRGTTKASTDEQLIEIYNDARGEYLQRKRDGKTWQTMESAIYGKKLESLWIQEDWSDNILSGSGEGASKEYVDTEITRVENEIPTKTSELENDSDFIDDAPNDNNIYGRENKQWKKTAHEADIEWGDF